jgi:hypothetical protein
MLLANLEMLAAPCFLIIHDDESSALSTLEGLIASTN